MNKIKTLVWTTKEKMFVVLKEVKLLIKILNAQAMILMSSNAIEKWLNIAHIVKMLLFNVLTLIMMKKSNQIKVTLEWLTNTTNQLMEKEVELKCGDQTINGDLFVTKPPLMPRLLLCANKWVSQEVNYMVKKDKNLALTIKEKISAPLKDQLMLKFHLVKEMRKLSLNVTFLTLLQIVLMMRMLLSNVPEIQEIHQEQAKKITMRLLFHHL
jgi:hypothetical protein